MLDQPEKEQPYPELKLEMRSLDRELPELRKLRYVTSKGEFVSILSIQVSGKINQTYI